MEESKKEINKGIIVLVLLLSLIFLFFIKKENREKMNNLVKNITVREKSLDFNNRIEMEEGFVSISLYDTTLIKWNNNNLSSIKNDASTLWEKDYEFQLPYVYYGDKWIYAIDKSSGHIYATDKNGDTIFKAQLNESIFAVDESQNNLIVHIKTEEGENIKILNDLGDILQVHEEDHHILYYELNKEKSNYSVSVLDMTSDTLVSRLGIYNIGGGKISSIDFENGIILKTQFIGEDLLVLTDTSLNYVKDGMVKWKRHFPAIQDFKFNGDKILMLYDKNFETISLDGKTVDKFIFAEDLKKIKVAEEFIILYGDYNIIGINADREILNYKMDKEIIGLYYNQSTLYIHNPESIEIYKLKNK